MTLPRTGIFISVLIAAIAGMVVIAAWADKRDENTYGIAIKGYDPVAYFTMGQAVKGSSEFKFLWNEAMWHFANDEHRKLFSIAPEKYAPRHSGY